MKLEPIKTPKMIDPFAVADIESMRWTEFLCVGLYDGKKFLWFKHLSDFFDALESEMIERVFCHFGGKFDFLFFLEHLVDDEKFKIDSLIPRGSGVLSFDLHYPSGHRVRFNDSSALLPFSLKTITENFGVAHKKQDLDVSNITRITPKLIEYLEHDCRGLYESLEKFWQWPLVADAGPATTLASQAVRVFRRTLKKPIHAPGKHIQEFIRKAYLGGRTEIFKPICEKGPLYSYDVNSLYPFAMLNPMPTGKTNWTYAYEKEKLGVYHARVQVPRMWVPPLGIIRNGKYIFPTGDFEGFWTSAELEYAKSLGVRFEVIEGIVFESEEKIFEDYVTKLYRIKSESESGSVSNIMSKLLLNSLYGRFGLNPEKENVVFEPSEGAVPFTDLKINGKTYGLWKKPVSLDSFYSVAIATFVTSYARIHMHRLYLDAGPSLFYTDTDSLFTKRKFKTSDSLGSLKQEGMFDSAVFLLPKTYALKEKEKTTKVAMKGFDKKKIKHFTYEDFKSALEGDIQRLKIDIEPRFATMKTALRQKKFVAMTKASTKQLRALYSKRQIIKSSGKLTTKPIHITE